MEDDEYVLLEDNRAILEWVDVAGQLLTSMHFGEIDEQHPLQAVCRTFHRSMVRHLEKNCLVLRCLDITTIYDNLFANTVLFATRGRLVKLIADSDHTPSISLYCTGLEELELRSEPSSLDFLRTVGATLKVFGFYDANNPGQSYSKKILEVMRAFCPNLCEVEVRIHRDEIASFAELLYSYGEKLQVLETCQFPADIQGKLVVACPRMRCKGIVMYTPGVGVLRSAVRQLLVVLPIEDEADVEKLSLDMQACPEIEEMDICVREENASDVVDAVLSLRNESSRCFDWRCGTTVLAIRPF